MACDTGMPRNTSHIVSPKVYLTIFLALLPSNLMGKDATERR